MLQAKLLTIPEEDNEGGSYSPISEAEKSFGKLLSEYKKCSFDESGRHLPDDTDAPEDNIATSLSNKPFSLIQKQFQPWKLTREKKLQEWEGQVISIDRNKGIFTATLTDVFAGETVETEEGDFPIDDLYGSNIELLEEGAVFRWIVGYKYIGTTSESFSRISFRNLPVWSTSELDNADREAERLNAIKWD